MLLTPKNPAPVVSQNQVPWSRADKLGVGTARSLSSSVWYTVANGIITEIYFPDVDSPQVRDFQLIFTDGTSFFHDAQRDFTHKCEWIDSSTPASPGVPTMGLRVTNTAIGQPYSYVQEIIAEPQSPCVLVRTTLQGDPAFLSGLHVYALLAPHMDGLGQNNNAYVVSTSNGARLVANYGNFWLALGADCGFKNTSCGFVGSSDGWTDIITNRRLAIWTYDAAIGGYVALTGELNLAGETQFVLAMGFCESEGTPAFGDMPATPSTPNQALTSVTEALTYPFDGASGTYSHLQAFLQEWAAVWQSPPNTPFVPRAGVTGDSNQLFSISRNVLLSHEDKSSSGALVASLSIPWGETVYDLAAGYHLVWPRDMSQSAMALLAAGGEDTALRCLMFLATSQSSDGSFAQKFFIDGQPWFGSNPQLDEFSFPILLAYRLHLLGKLQGFDPRGMVMAAAAAIIIYGPITTQERWEEQAGFSPSTLAANIAALVAAADLAANAWGDVASSNFFFQYADFLESNLEKWCLTTQGTLVPGKPTHYVRILPSRYQSGDFRIFDPNTTDPSQSISIGGNSYAPKEIVDGGFLELVRYGIRDPRDPNIVASVAVIDAKLQTTLPQGPGYHRYNNDVYGQGPQGQPWVNDNSGIGRPWPLLTGERGHYEVALGNDATPYVHYIENFAGLEKLIPEQIWDQPDRTNPTFKLGGPTGSARPLAWAHAEYIKLVCSVSNKKVFDRVDAVEARYLDASAPPTYRKVRAPNTLEIFNLAYRPSQMKAGYTIRFPLGANFKLRWTGNNWSTSTDTDATQLLSSLPFYYVDIPTTQAQAGITLKFSIFWKNSQTWQSYDDNNTFQVTLV